MKLNVILDNAVSHDTGCKTHDSTINSPKSARDVRNGIFGVRSVYDTYVKYFGAMTVVNRHTTLGVCFCGVRRAVCVHKVAAPTIHMPTLDTGKQSREPLHSVRPVVLSLGTRLQQVPGENAIVSHEQLAITHPSDWFTSASALKPTVFWSYFAWLFVRN